MNGRRGLTSSMVAAVMLSACVAQLPAPYAPTNAPGAIAPVAGTAEQLEGEVTVFAAASLTDPFGEIGQAFQRVHPGVNVSFHFAGSRALRTQIEEGAVADVFASADFSEMELLIGAGMVAAGSGREFARNRLVVVLPRDNPARLVTLGDLRQPGIKIVMAAEEVPVGKYARQALTNLNVVWGPSFAESVLRNVVSNEENVKQVLAKVSLGEADAGIVYSTDAMADPSLPTLPIDDAHNVTASYPLAVLLGAPRVELAERFVAFVLSAEGQAILASYGFMPPEPG